MMIQKFAAHVLEWDSNDILQPAHTASLFLFLY